MTRTEEIGDPSKSEDHVAGFTGAKEEVDPSWERLVHYITQYNDQYNVIILNVYIVRLSITHQSSYFLLTGYHVKNYCH